MSLVMGNMPPVNQPGPAQLLLWFLKYMKKTKVGESLKAVKLQKEEGERGK